MFTKLPTRAAGRACRFVHNRTRCYENFVFVSSLCGDEQKMAKNPFLSANVVKS